MVCKWSAIAAIYGDSVIRPHQFFCLLLRDGFNTAVFLHASFEAKTLFLQLDY